MEGGKQKQREEGARGGIHFAAEHPLKCETRDFPTRLSSDGQRGRGREGGRERNKKKERRELDVGDGWKERGEASCVMNSLHNLAKSEMFCCQLRR